MKDVHTEHCCARHGCKYGDDDCTVEFKGFPQSYPCEWCDDEPTVVDYVILRRDSPDTKWYFTGTRMLSLQDAKDTVKIWNTSGTVYEYGLGKIVVCEEEE